MLGDIYLYTSPVGELLVVETSAGFYSAIKGMRISNGMVRVSRFGTVEDLDFSLKVWSDEAREAARQKRLENAERNALRRARRESPTESGARPPRRSRPPRREPELTELQGMQIQKRAHSEVPKDQLEATAKRHLNGHSTDEVIVKLGIPKAQVNCFVRNNGVAISVEGKQAKMSVFVNQNKDFEVVKMLSNTKEHGAGFVRDRGKQILETAEMTGSKRIRIQAGLHDGAYSWARMGFEPVNAVTFQRYKSEALRNARHNKVNIGPEEYIQLRDAKTIKDFSSVKDKRGRRVGKEVMYRTSWEGKLDLDKNNPGYNVYRRYVGMK